LDTQQWTPDKFDSSDPVFAPLLGLHKAAAQLVGGNTLFVYGGVIVNAESTLYKYDLTLQQWSIINQTVGRRVSASLAAASPTRALLFGAAPGMKENSSIASLANDAYCNAQVGCVKCVATPGCLFAVSDESACVAGAQGIAYVPKTVAASSLLVASRAACPQPRAPPGWLIPVVVVVLVVIVLVVAGSYWLDTRKSRQRSGYQTIPTTE
jgi:hypothetical protein